MRRNKAGALAVAMVTLALVGGLVATTLEARRANRRFEDMRRLAKSILFEIEPQIADLPGSTLARATLVKRALEYLDDLSREAGGRSDLRRELAAAYEKVGDVQGGWTRRTWAIPGGVVQLPQSARPATGFGGGGRPRCPCQAGVGFL